MACGGGYVSIAYGGGYVGIAHSVALAADYRYGTTVALAIACHEAIRGASCRTRVILPSLNSPIVSSDERKVCGIKQAYNNIGSISSSKEQGNDKISREGLHVGLFFGLKN